MTADLRLPTVRRRLTTRLLLWTAGFVILAEVLVYVPSIARFRVQALRDVMADAHLATLAIDAASEAKSAVSPELVDKLLGQARALAVIRFQDGQPRRVALGEVPQRVDATFDLRETTPMRLVAEAFATLVTPESRPIRVIDYAPKDGQVLLEVFLDEGPIRDEMLAFSWRILWISGLISIIAACLLFLTLHWLLVRPIRRMTNSIASFRDAPEDPARLMRPSGRRDEIGFAERELRDMQEGLRAALRQREHLAALGTAVTKINHDLRNALSSAQLVSDRIADSADPQVRRVAPTLVRAIDRAILLCAQTLEYARGQEHAIDTAPFDFAALVDEAIQALAPATPAAKLVNEVPRPFTIAAGRPECERMVTNLLRNAAQAGATTITVRAQRNAGADGDRKSPARPDAVAIDVIDNGPGLAADARAHLFEPFASARKGGTGLGLAIVRDLVEAHGGTVRLLDCGTGAHFRIELPRA